ncbi:putative bifunctional diguanylate cyclase/phosphodiesterase [Hartmannibacter diazotrophicus]|nr:bifunctional diguanylate cyclase/phosphodiesterase [Hartmannibacter diazotrophicus]
MLAILLTGVGGFVYGWRRIQDLRKEIVRRDAAEMQANYLANHDALTGLFNRRYMERVKQADDPPLHAHPAIFSIDLDGFKRINDLMGHHGGDELLRVVAERLRNRLPQATIARMGGDEFLIAAESDGDDAALTMGRDIVAAICEPIALDKTMCSVGASVGVSTKASKDGSLGEAERQADVAMYVAKRNGPNNVCLYDPSMNSVLDEKIRIERDLRSAIAANEITPHYQPLIRLETGEIIGFEALARWPRADGTVMQPASFIGVAEEAGLITDLFSNLLEKACRDAVEWPAGFLLSFNLSASQLTDRLLGLRIVQILGKTGFPASRLEIELTESVVVREMDAALAIMTDLRNAGVRIAIDDFGTGFSSLSQIAKIPFDKIKIDRSFISAFGDDDRQMKIIKLIVGLGHGLGVTTLAEGIENEGQLEILNRLGCEYGQGFLFAKAMPSEEIAEFLRTHEPASIATGTTAR